MAGESKVAVIAALVANFIIAILKLGAGLISGSASMLAEAAHSFSDVGNQVLLLIGIRGSKGPASPRHPYGTAKSAYFWPFMVAILLFGVAGAYSLIEGIEKVRHPHELGDLRLALWVLGIAVVVEAVSLAIAFREALKGARAANIRSVPQFLEENRDATLLTVLVEDALALVGILVAMAALLVARATGNPVWDGVGSLFIGGLLMGFALFLAWEVRALLLGVGMTERNLALVRQVLKADPTVDDVVSIQSMHLGPEVVLLGVEVDLADTLTLAEVEDALRRLEQALVEAVPVVKYVYLEPRNRKLAPPPARKAHSAS